MLDNCPCTVGIKGNEETSKAAKAANALTRSHVDIPISDYNTSKPILINK